MKVSLMITCLCDVLYPSVGEAVVRILNHCGVKVHFPYGQTCCGQPAFNSGYWDEAKTAALNMLEAFEDSDFVICPSGSCIGMIHKYYPQLFADDQLLLEKAKRFASKTYEFSQFLVQVLGIKDLGAVFPYKVTYHPSCHGTRLLGVRDEPMELLKHVQEM
jgi:L-lactate dehydrogenase complex protein LldE